MTAREPSLVRRDPHQVLGIEPGAPPEAVTAAWRRAAMDHHPDRNPGEEAEASERFREAKDAYESLNGARAGDDLASIFGLDPFTTAAGDDETAFGTRFSDTVFANLLRAAAAMRAGQPPTPADADDAAAEAAEPARGERDAHEIEIDLTFAEALAGHRVPIPVRTRAPCPRCTPRRTANRVCRACAGTAERWITAKADVQLPSNLRAGERFSVRNDDGSIPRGPPTTIIVRRVAPDPRFERHGAHLRCEAAIDLATAVLGGDATLETPLATVRFAIPAGTRTGDIREVAGAGIPHRAGGGQGLLCVRIVVDTPREAPPRLIRALKRMRAAARRVGGRTDDPAPLEALARHARPQARRRRVTAR